jgi:3-deoxy-manno-octulosonate cytidylyltransferase (CMP-KDO synthetase)
MNYFKAIIVIPARLNSSRLPSKVLAMIDEHPMLWHVYQRCRQVSKASEVHIATDTEKVAELVRQWGGKVWMTDSNCVSGTERIVSILDQLEADIIINVQADQPTIEPALIHQVIEQFEKTEPIPDIVTPIYPIKKESKLFSSSIVKVTRRHDGYALYFSRSPIPFVRDKQHWLNGVRYWGHVGVYGYRRQVLEEYHSFPKSDLEESEKLEQLRFLQAGKNILTFETSDCPISIDTIEDLQELRFQKS